MPHYSVGVLKWPAIGNDPPVSKKRQERRAKPVQADVNRWVNTSHSCVYPDIGPGKVCHSDFVRATKRTSVTIGARAAAIIPQN